MNNNDYCNVWVTPRAYDLADWLIVRFSIQDGYGLARYLGVSRRYTNHRAVQVWVAQQQRNWPEQLRTTGNLRRAFLELLPEYR